MSQSLLLSMVWVKEQTVHFKFVPWDTFLKNTEVLFGVFILMFVEPFVTYNNEWLMYSCTVNPNEPSQLLNVFLSLYTKYVQLKQL